jgi:hypothetical protein
LFTKNQCKQYVGKDEMLKPIRGFDAKAIVTLMKGNTGREPRLQLPAAEANAPDVASSPEVMAMLSKMQRDSQIFYAWNDRFTAWLKAQFVYCLPADKQIRPMPLFRQEILPEEVDEPQPE